MTQTLARVVGLIWPKWSRDQLTPQMAPAQISEAERLVTEWEPKPAECETIGAQAEN